MKNSIKWILIAVIAVSMLFAGCSEEQLSYEGELAFTGLTEEFAVAYDDIYAMDAVTETVTHLSSEGDETTNEVVGVKLSTLLAQQGLSQKDFNGLRLVAGDGYAIDVPAEIVKEKEIILAYKFDGEYLEDKKMPLRAAIDDVRSMYFVSNLVEIQFVMGEEKAEDAENEIILLETAFMSLEKYPYTYYESEDEAILGADLFSAYLDSEPESVYMMASDGYDKTEDFQVVKDGYIKITGKDAPLFTGKDLPKGMNVKYIMNLAAKDVSFVSVKSCMDGIGVKNINGKEGAAFEKIVEMANLTGDYYTLTAADGYSVEVSKDSLSNAVIYVMDDGTCAAAFDESYPKNANIKNLLSISLSDGSNCVTGVNEESSEEAKEEDVTGWTITFKGLSDGSFDFTGDKAERKLELVEVHTERMKNDEVYPEDWKGYRLLDVLEFLKVEEFSSVFIMAGDGYEIELPREQIDEDTILAIEKNGEKLTEEDNLVQLVQNTEYATTWVKGVVEILVN